MRTITTWLGESSVTKSAVSDSKTKPTLVVLSLICTLCAAATRQTKAIPPWIQVHPVGERFRARMPHSPAVEKIAANHRGVSASGKKYSATADKVVYTIWSLKIGETAFDELNDYLDAIAEMAWDSLLKPARDQLLSEDAATSKMIYHDVRFNPLSWEREYLLRLGKTEGVLRLIGDGHEYYVVTVFNGGSESAAVRRFFNSFNPNFKMTYGGLPPVTIDPKFGLDEFPPRPLPPNTRIVDYDRTFLARDVDEKAIVYNRPEPVYTAAARQFGVEGTVVIGVVLSKDGNITSCFPRRELPHGLTGSAIAAVKRIAFSPAKKDGRTVSQYVDVEYKFSLY